MNNIATRPINTYQDLVEEKERLEELLKIQRSLIQNDIRELKEEFKPAVQVANVIGKITTREDGQSDILTKGTSLTLDLLVSRLFSKSNFLVRLIVPAVLKNLSSHYLPKAVPMIKRIVVGPSRKQETSEHAL